MVQRSRCYERNVEFSETDTVANNILLVGNATEHHLQITRFLLQQDYTVHSTKNIEEALIYIGNNLPDLILINLSPFDLCACALCAHLKSIRKIREIPVIFISQSNTHEERIQAFANGASDYITTPIIVRELHIRVSTHLALRSQPLGPDRLFRNRTAEPQKRNKRFMEKNGNPTLEAPPCTSAAP